MLDLLDEKALAGKVVLPIATGGSPAHLLALEYGLKPVLSALGARHILAGVYATDKQVRVDGRPAPYRRRRGSGWRTRSTGCPNNCVRMPMSPMKLMTCRLALAGGFSV